MRFNRDLIKSVNSDSGCIGITLSIGHRFEECGTYHGVLYSGKEIAGNFDISVLGLSEDRQHCDPGQNNQLNIDLVNLRVPTEQNNKFSVEEGAYVIFHVSKGSEKYSIKM